MSFTLAYKNTVTYSPIYSVLFMEFIKTQYFSSQIIKLFLYYFYMTFNAFNQILIWNKSLYSVFI